jgi:hypothetical protein
LIEVASYFLKDDLNNVLASLKKLPEILRPIYFSDSESVADSQSLLSDTKRFDSFLKKNPDGFFLKGDNCLYDFKLYSKGYSQVYLDLPDGLQEHLIPFFEEIAESVPVFAYAADEGERKHRNRCYKTIGANHIEDWVGRDVSKYISGLYCYTLISSELIEQHGLDTETLAASALLHSKLGCKGQLHLFKFYDDTREWKAQSERLDELCYTTEGVFSIRNVLSATEGINNFADYDDVIFEWR